MISSMTGYGRGEAAANGFRITAEIRTLNNRFFDFALRAPRSLINFEAELRELCRSQITRGRVTLLLTETRGAEAPGPAHVDRVAATKLARELSALAFELGLQGGVTLDHLLHFPDLLVQVEDPSVTATLLALARTATEAALTDLQHMRRAEGEKLAADMVTRLSALSNDLEAIEKHSVDAPVRALERLRERVKRITLPQAFDEYRLEMELALLADRLDITEECVRLRGHIGAFRHALASPDGAQGKRLEFLLQEMHREANTISSKSAALEIAHLGVHMREEIERLREQVQNIE